MKSILIMMTTLLSLFCINKNQVYPSKQERLVNHILDKAATLIEKKYKLNTIGQGSAMPGGVIRKFNLVFDTNKRYPKEYLRKLLIDCTNDLLHQVNTNEEIRPFLIKDPFTEKNVQIIIHNHDKNRRELFDPEIAVAEISEGILTYKTNDPNDSFKYKNTYTERYTDALRALQFTLN